MKKQPPEIFRPFIWWAKWGNVDVREDKEDLVMSAVNEGTLRHWRWITNAYGKDEIRRILQKRLVTEFHPESRNLAKLIFSITNFRHARGSAH